jgi:hypothetical protein
VKENARGYVTVAVILVGVAVVMAAVHLVQRQIIQLIYICLISISCVLLKYLKCSDL